MYPIHQRLRREVIERFPEHRILIMPQPIHFGSPDSFSCEERALYQSHKGLTMHVRDVDSYNFMLPVLGESRLRMAPDMASMLIGNWPWGSRTQGTLLFRRRDIEAVGNGDVPGQPSFDWEQLFSVIDIKIYWWIVRLAKMEGRWRLNLGVSWMWDRFVARTLAKASQYYSCYGVVDTDRLHGMIFALLLGKDVIMQDNSYGKIRRYYSRWLAGNDSGELGGPV